MHKLIIPPLFVFISLILIFSFYCWLPGYNRIPFPFNLCGIVVAFSGFLIMGKARMLFNKYHTPLAIKQSSHMITDGIYSKTRNPMYIGMFFLLLGTAICFRNLFAILTPFAFIVIIRLLFIPKEEELMYESFGEQYLEYKKNVKRWI